MKKALLVSLYCIVFYSFPSHAQTAKKVVVSSKSPVKAAATRPSKTIPNGPRIKFAHDVIDFGTIKEDSILEKTFVFTNTGNADLVVINATGSCGCTIPTYPQTPIRPGDKGSIVVKFTAKNKFGPQKPTVTVTTNATPRLSKLQLDGWVEQIPGGVN